MQLEEAVELAKLSERIAKDACAKMREECRLHFPDDRDAELKATTLAAGIMVGALREAFGTSPFPEVQMIFLAGTIQGVSGYEQARKERQHGTKP